MAVISNQQCQFVPVKTDVSQVWCADDYKCRRTLRSAFVVEILLVSGKGRFIFCTGQSDAKHGVIAIWHGHPGKEPIRVLQAHGKQVRCLFAPDDSGEELYTNSKAKFEHYCFVDMK